MFKRRKLLKQPVGILLLAAMIGGLGAPAPARAQDGGFLDPSKWDGSLAIFGWLLSLHGDAVIADTPAPVNTGFGVILNNLDGAMFGDGRLYYDDHFGVFLNGVYGKVSDDREEIIGPVGVGLGATVKLTYLTFGAAYRFDPIDLGNSPFGDGNASVRIEPFAGGRYYDIEATVFFDGILFGTRGEREGSFVDPIIGLRSEWELAKRWSLVVGGDIGGFGLGSDFSWDTFGALEFRFGLREERDGGFFVGYRANGVDYEKSATRKWNVVTRGPVVGVRWRF